jgi:hypothetical protein
MRKIYKSAFLLFFSGIVIFTASAQNIEWEKKLGGNPEWTSTPGIDQGKSVIALADGTSVALINSSSAEGDFPTNSGKRDAWLFKLNSSGGTIWKQRYGGAGDDLGNQVIATSDGGFIISGQTTSYPGPDINAWIIKTDALGNQVWNKSFGGSQTDVANSICQTGDGYVFTGHTKSNNGHLTGIKTTINEEDVWYVKLDLNGNIGWNKIFGGGWIDQGHSIISITDGTGFAIAGFTQSNDRDVTGLLKGWRSGLVFKFDNGGTVVWKKTFGGNDDSRAYAIINIAGGGFAFAGTTQSSASADVINPKGGYDYWLVKLDANGTRTFSKNYGAGYTDFAYNLVATPDGGYVLIGRSDSPSGGSSDLTTATRRFDSWAIKVDAAGNKAWDMNYRFGDDWGDDNGASVTVNASGEILITGAIVPGVPHNDWNGTKDENAFVIKYNASGSQIWANNFGVQRKFTGFDKGISIKQAPDGSYYFLAATESNDGDVASLAAKGLRDILIQKWDVNRNLIWQKIIGGLKMDDPKDMKVTPDGGVIIAATSYSTDGDLPGTIGNTIHGDLWLIKMSASGSIEWKKNYGGYGDDYAHSIELAPGGGYVVATHSWSGSGGDISAANGESNAWVIKVDAAGNKVWEKSFGGAGQDEANKIIATTDGGYAISGWTRSTDGDGTGNHGGLDAFIVKFDANGNRQWSKAYGGTADDFGDAVAQAPDGSLFLTGRSNSSNGDIAPLTIGYTGEYNTFILKLSVVNGSIIWSKSIGSSYYDEVRDLTTSPTGDPMLVLFSDGGPGDFTENKGFHDTWIVKMNGADGTIKWKKNYGASLHDDPVSISRANNGGYLIAGVRNFDNMWDQMDFTNNGEAYAIKVSDNEVHSVTITTSGPTTYCEGGSVTLTAVSPGTNTYQWFKNGTSITGATNTTYFVNAAGNYSVNATNSSGAIATASIDVTVYPTPIFTGPYNAGDIKQAITFGGLGFDAPLTFRQGMVATTDGGYIFTGQTNSNNNGDLTGLTYNGGPYDVVVVKLDCGFNVQWKKTFGGSGNDVGYAVIQTADGGYMVTAITFSAVSGDVTVAKGGQDAWLIKLDANGNKQWQKSYGGSGGEAIDAIVQTPGGDYIGVGWTASTDGDLAGVASKGLNDMWMLKIAGDGTILAQRRAGGSSASEEAFYVSKTNDGNYIMSGFSNSTDGDIIINKGFNDGYLEKFDINLNKIWAKTYGGSGNEQFYMVKPTADGGYVVGTHSSSTASGDFTGINNGQNDIWIVKVAGDGAVLWNRNYGGPSSEQGHSIEVLPDGGFALSGVTFGNGGDVTGFKGILDSWLLRLDENGNLVWQKTYGGTQNDFGNVVVKNSTGELVVLGRTQSVDGDISGLTNNGGADFWLKRIADCSSFVTATVTPAASTSIIYANSFTLSANTGSGYSYQWYRNNTAIAGATGATYDAVQNGFYKVRISVAGSCTGYSNEVGLLFNHKYYVNDNSTTGDIFTSAIGNNSNSGSAAAPFATLSYAVSQVKAGDTIYVDAGTFTEQVTIDKGLTIIGAGNTLTSFNKPATGIVPPAGDFTETALIQSIQNIGDIHLQDMSITGDASIGLQCVIIQTGGSVNNCKLLDGNQGIFFRVASATKTVIIENNEINVPYIGVNVQGSGLSLLLRNNNINANNPGFSAGVFAGLDFGPLVQLIATGNLITNYKNNGFLSNSLNSNITQNSFTGLNGSLAIQQQSGNALNATCNWFGTRDAEVIKSLISGSVNYAPWLINGIDTSTAIGFQSELNICNGRQNKFYVNDNNQTGDVFTTAIGNNANNGFSTSPFATIDYAVNVGQTGDTIFVDAGTYDLSNANLLLSKSITILGTNYQVSPNDGSDKLLTNVSRKAESIITNGILSIGATNISFKGLTFDMGNHASIELQTSGIPSDLINFIFEKNILKINTLNTFNQLIITGKTVTSPALPLTAGFTFSDNRFERSGSIPGTTFTLNFVKDITVSNNAFVVTGSTFKNQHIANIGNTGIVDNYNFQNNVADGAGIIANCARVSSGVISDNVLINCDRGVNVTGTMPQSSSLEFNNNTLIQTTGGTPFLSYNRTGSSDPSVITVFKVQNNIISGTRVDGLANQFYGAMNFTLYNSEKNPLLTISGNQISFSGDFSSVGAHEVRPITVRGNVANLTMESNDIKFINSGTLAAALGLPSNPAFTINTDYLSTANMPSNAIINIRNNKVEGFKQSLVFYDGANGKDAFTGYGNIPIGATVNVNNNSFTGDSISINNGTTSEMVNANCNWYGSGSSQNVIPKVTKTTVNYDPWLTNGTDHDLATGFQPVPNSCTGAGVDADVITVKNVTCKDAADGSIDINMEEGVAPFTYEWSKDNVAGFSNEEDLTGIGPGIYKLTVTDVNGSIDNSISVTITEPDVLLTASSTGTNVNCFGGSNGTASVTASGGNEPYTYLWNTGSTASSISNLTAGTYSVTTTDANGCSIAGEVIISEPEMISLVIDGSDVSCNGYDDGSISLSLAGGTGAYSFLWNTGETESSIYDLSAGTYSVDVTDENGCKVSETYTVTEPAILNAIATGTNVTSTGGSDGIISLAITGGTEPYDVLWSNEATSTELTGLSTGVYSATITDNYGCTTTASFEVKEPSSSLTINVTGTNVNCYNGNDGSASVEVTSGTAPFTYAWSNSGSLATISDLPAGTYTVIVTDANNISASGSYTVASPATPVSINVSATPVSCFNGNNGTASVTANGGTGSYTYLWSTSGTLNVISNLTAGTYTVTVTDANGCTTAGNTEVIQPTQLVAAATGTNVSCNGSSDGSATASATGGFEPYSYLWSNNVTTASNTNLSIGTYTVTITDANGCINTASYTVTQPSPLTGTITKNDVTCFGTSNGSISVIGKGGTPSYLYSLNNGDYTNTNSWINLIPGSYSVSVKDANDCIYNTSVVITQPQPLVINIDGVTNTCQGSANGVINITVSGGTTKYSFKWTGPNGYTSVKEDIASLNSGIYTITATDANGCIQTSTATVTELQPPSVTETITHVNCFDASTGSIAITVDPTGVYTYNWSGANGYKATTQNISNVKAGTYTVIITPSGGCTKTASFVVTQPTSALAFTTSKTDISVCGGTGRIVVNATGGTAPYQYSKGGGIYQSENSFEGLLIATYPITVKDNNGCITASANVSIIDNGSDIYEANEKQTNAKEIVVNTVINNARIAPTNTDKDWYKFTTTSAGTYSLTVTHSTVLYAFDIYDSKGRIITPATVSGATKNYSLLANTIYWVQVRGSLSLICYQMQVSSTTINSTTTLTATNINEPTSNETVSLKGNPEVSLTELKATVYPNPHQGNFNLNVHTNKDGEGIVRLVNVAGQIVDMKKVKLIRGIDNIVRFTGRHEAILFYQLKVGNHVINGKVIGIN